MSAFIMFLTGLDNRHLELHIPLGLPSAAHDGVIFVSYVREIPT